MLVAIDTIKFGIIVVLVLIDARELGANLPECDHNSDDLHADCNLNTSYIMSGSCTCVSCGKEYAFCLQTASDRYWIKMCNEWKKSGYCKNLFKLKPTPTMAVTEQDGTSSAIMKAKVSTSKNFGAPTDKSFDTEVTELSSRGSNARNDYPLTVVLPVILIFVAVLAVSIGLFIHCKRTRKRARQASDAERGLQRSLMNRNSNDGVEDIQLGPIISGEAVVHPEDTHEEGSNLPVEVESSILDSRDIIPEQLSMDMNVHSFGSTGTISVNAAAIAQLNASFGEHGGNFNSTESFTASSVPDTAIWENLQDPNDVFSRPQVDSISQYGNQMDSNDSERSETPSNSQENGSSAGNYPALCSAPVPLDHKIDNATLVGATQDGDPQQLNEPPTPGENLPLTAQLNP